VQFAHEVIVDSQVIAEYYRQHYGTQTRYIPYGARLDVPAETDVLERLGLSPFRYLLFVGRLTPEKQVHHLVEAYAGITTEFPLVIVGDDPFSREYITRLKSMAPPGVRFAGLIYDAGFRQLCANAYLYCTPSAIEGTSPALLGAMGMGACPLVNGIPENLETIGNAGFSYRANDVTDLCQQLQRLLAEPDRVRQTGRRARERVAQWYSWDTATRQLEAVYRGMEEREPRLRPMG
jgi:glycosyltransferase involved in cell wall biosynthesis